MTKIGVAALLMGIIGVSSSEDAKKSLISQIMQRQSLAECVKFTDKNLEMAIGKIDDGIKGLQAKYPSLQRPNLNYGLRGTRYFIEFPITGRNIDAFSILTTTQQLLNQKNNQNGSRVVSTDSFIQDENVSYLIDYEVTSTTAIGAKNRGSIYIRGIKGDGGFDSYKFVLEKSVDFHDLDIQIILKAYEEAFKPKQNTLNIDEGSIKKPIRQSGQQPKQQANPFGAVVSQNQPQQEDQDPTSRLQRLGCTVFMPDKRNDKLDWDYLAGYEKVKRNIEDTVLLALTHGHVYDQITQNTRMKNETNRPKCVLFEGPPGCGKTTSAKIISQQVNIPLVYMPLEAIMSKYYGESESRLADIFEAAQAMGSVILFIDEIDALATSRESGLHEATRRILSTLLRKIDSFESDGEVLVVCATNRKKDLDPALISRIDLGIKFELPDSRTRALIFKRYAKQLSEIDLEKLADITINLSGRDISDICKDAERKWASKFIRKEVDTIVPDISVYLESAKQRLDQIQDTNLRMEINAGNFSFNQRHVPSGRILLHVYDLSQGMASQFSRQLCGRHIEGVWHTGIVVYGKEYYYGGGVSYDEPGFTPFGPPTKTLELGFTEINEELFMEFLREISPRFTADTYNVLKHNCNNFTDECAQFLLGNGIPKDIVDLPNIFLNTPLGKMVGPMLTQMQDNLKVNSHQLFNQNTGQQNPIVHHPGSQGASAGGMNNQNMNDLNGFINQFASGMGGFGGGGAGAMPQQQQQQQFGQPQQSANSHGGVIQIQNLQQLQKLIKETPALAIDFWSPTCPPCMRIKPVFESLCQSNDNDNLKFAAVNTQTCRDCAQAFNITSIPQFYFYVNGVEHSQFKGARQDQLVSTLAEISELVKSKSSQHKNLNYKQFKPMNLAPQGFTSMANIEKMREFVQNFINSEDVKKEGLNTDNLTKWLIGFKIENMPREAIDELMRLIDVAEDKSKIALLDLIRLLMLQEHSAAHILHKHFSSFEVSIFGYLQCMDVKDPDAKVIQNYHLICLKMLGNIYQTVSGKDYMQGEEPSSALLSFCTFSFDSVNPKVVFTAAVLMFNHLLCWKRDKTILQKDLQNALTKILTIIQDQTLVDIEAVLGILLCECRIFYQNKNMCELVTSKLEDQFKKSHQALEIRVKDPKVRQAIDDVFMMLFE